MFAYKLEQLLERIFLHSIRNRNPQTTIVKFYCIFLMCFSFYNQIVVVFLLWAAGDRRRWGWQREMFVWFLCGGARSRRACNRVSSKSCDCRDEGYLGLNVSPPGEDNATSSRLAHRVSAHSKCTWLLAPVSWSFSLYLLFSPHCRSTKRFYPISSIHCFYPTTILCLVL